MSNGSTHEIGPNRPPESEITQPEHLLESDTHLLPVCEVSRPKQLDEDEKLAERQRRLANVKWASPECRPFAYMLAHRI